MRAFGALTVYYSLTWLLFNHKSKPKSCSIAAPTDHWSVSSVLQILICPNTFALDRRALKRVSIVWDLIASVFIFWNFFLPLIWKKVEEYLRLFETCGEIQISLFPLSLLRKLVLFSGRMGLRMKLTAKKELNLLFQMTPSRILCD